jgi:copper(I)-binding protein
MKSKLLFIVAAFVVIAIAACGAESKGDITARDAWARPTAAKGSETTSVTPAPNLGANISQTQAMTSTQVDGPVSAVYLVINNTTGSADRLLSVTSSIADVAEVHQTMLMNGGMMDMKPISGGLEIPAHTSVAFAPGGYHIMLMDLHHDLIVGQTFTLTLKFQSGKQVGLDVPVKEAQ